MTNPIASSARWGCSGMLLGAAAGALALLPFRPVDPEGFEDLGWILMTMALAAALALVGGAVGLARGLRGEPRRGLTIAVFLVLAVLLAAFSAGAAALVAPPLARWLVELVAERRAGASPVSRG